MSNFHYNYSLWAIILFLLGFLFLIFFCIDYLNFSQTNIQNNMNQLANLIFFGIMGSMFVILGVILRKGE